MLNEHLSLYRSLNRNKVKYLVIGGIAAVIYGVPRTTIDIDIFIEKTLHNIKRLLKALKEIDFGTASLTTAQKVFDNEITVFEDYIRLDVLTKAKGLEFNAAWGKRNVKRINGVGVKFACIQDIIKSKKASNRKIDREDIRILKKILKYR